MENKHQASALISGGINAEVITKAVQLQDLLISTSFDFLQALRSKDMKACQININDITAALSALENVYDNQKIESLPIVYNEMFRNITWTIDKIIDNINEDQDEKAEDLTEFQLIPFIREWKEDTYFWLLVYPDSERMKQYYKSEFAMNHRNSYQNRGEKYLVSIFIPVYNKLEYTKKCLKSLYRHTDFEKYPCELILLNDGSTDGTEDYFDSLGVRKVITLKENLKTLIFPLMYRVCQGKYAAFVNNDTILTEHWLDNLLTCIQSDPMIISAVPSTPNTSNLQAMEVKITAENAEEAAKKHNHSNPLLWEERSRLMPVIALYDMDKVDTIGFADRYFYTMEYWDDDFSLRARRAGYKQILCKDTWCYHFGSVSGREDQVKNRTLQKGRDLFIKKHGVDAWGNGFCYDSYLMGLLEQTIGSLPYETTILGIDTGFGGDIRQLKNIIKRHGKRAKASVLISDLRFVDDFGPDDYSVLLSPYVYEIHKNMPEETFLYICIGQELSAYPVFAELLTECVDHLAKGGILTFYVSNPYSYMVKTEITDENLLNGKRSFTLINVNEVMSLLKVQGLHVQVHTVKVPNHLSDFSKKSTEHIDKYLFLCTKK